MIYNKLRKETLRFLHSYSRRPKLHDSPEICQTKNSFTCLSQRHSSYSVNTNTTNQQLPTPIVTSINVGHKNQDEILRLIFDDHEAWNSSFCTRNLSFFSNSLTTKSTGLFRNPELTSPQGFQVAADKALNKAKFLVNSICLASTEEELRMVVKNLDQLSNVLCSVIDLAEFVRNAHPDQEFSQAANRTYVYLCSYMNTLNTNTELYKVLKRVLSTPRISSHFSDEEVQVANVFLRDFEKSGIHLPSSQREQYVKLSDKIIALGCKFAQTPPNREIRQIEVYPASRLEGLNPEYTESANSNRMAILPTNQWEMVLKYVKDEQVRKDMYIAANSASKSQIDTLENLLRTRAELANLVGMESYGHMSLNDKMVKTPENVQTFLRTLADHHRPKALADLQLLQKAKERYTGSKIPATLNAWDRDYYTVAVMSQSSAQPLAPISPFFSVGSVIQGLSNLFSRLYGISFQPAEVMPGEVWHEDVRKLDVVDETEGKIGTIYCDLFNRHGKFKNAAHYTVRCSRRVDVNHDNNENDHLISDLSELNDLSSFNRGVKVKGKTGLYQLPVVVLMCDFARPRGRNDPTLLSWGEVETLFHEMGHAMHSMIGRTDFHNVAGTRCPTDFVELPSILMEHFVSSPQVLATFANHYQTRDPIPFNLIKSHKKAHSTFAAIDIQLQIVMALLDQLYHSSLATTSSFDTTAILANLQDTVGLFPSVPKTAWQIQFAHLFGYGAGYYSYLFGQVLAGKLWKEIFEKDPLSREAGEKFRRDVLQWGGSRDPWLCVGNALNDERIIAGDNKSMLIVGEWVDSL
ncbi:5581_t:CDS:2 [Ambispora gerdemannii]|uniref:mitochondrial intermediate peptidase n=1 Tax=Ambispora gerdemannii TaxID=144530 RepID=A0A9N8V6L7_9GLOM|nr:5581_t:CDS:2 [Ambispora gerdemannii]